MGRNQSGYKSSWINLDTFYQQDLAQIGTKVSVYAQQIDNDFRLSGTIILIKKIEREEAFKSKDIPIYYYSVLKTVTPFSVLQPAGYDYVEFSIPPVEGKPTHCQIKISLDESNLDHRLIGGTDPLGQFHPAIITQN